MQEGVFTKIGAIATAICAIPVGIEITKSIIQKSFSLKTCIFISILILIIVLVFWLYTGGLQEENRNIPDVKNIQVKIDILDREPLYTISSGASLKARQDVYLPAYKDVLYIQKGKFINKDNVDEYDYIVILKFKKSDKIRKISSGKNLEITDSSRHGPEDREFRHAYVYLKVDNEDIDYLKCLGKNSSEQITIGQFRNVMKGIIDVNIPAPKEI